MHLFFLFDVLFQRVCQIAEAVDQDKYQLALFTRYLLLSSILHQLQ